MYVHTLVVPMNGNEDYGWRIGFICPENIA